MTEEWIRLPLYEAVMELVMGLDRIIERGEPSTGDLTLLRDGVIAKLKRSGAVLEATSRTSADTLQEMRHTLERQQIEADRLGLQSIPGGIETLRKIAALRDAETALRDWSWRSQYTYTLRSALRDRGEGRERK